jgi:sialidase-1
VLFDDAPDTDLGYPSTVELSDGSLLTVYYQKYAGDEKCSILQTRWRLKN